MRLKKIVLGLSAVAAAAVLAACSGGSSASNGSPTLAANTGNSSAGQSSPAAPLTVQPTTLPPATTTTPPVTTKPPVTTTKPPVTKAPVQATEAASTGVPCAPTSGVSACVDLSAHEAWILDNGQIEFGPVHAEGGRKGWTTPVGNFHVTQKSIHYVSHEFNVPMPYAVFFYPGDAFHEGSASTPSHGCVHLSLNSAQTFYKDLSIGDPVQIIR